MLSMFRRCAGADVVPPIEFKLPTAALAEFNILLSQHIDSISRYNTVLSSLLDTRHYDAYKAMLFYNYIKLKGGFQFNSDTYQILVNGLCYSGETQRAIQLLGQVLLLKIHTRQEMYDIVLLYNEIILRLGKDRLVIQAYDLYSKMIVNNIIYRTRGKRY
ncbi:PPR repeat protein [Medicago truncatula]|uniref:PPR repeat protein n=1 Tax=Medicago truncatula TaxID=3880 RepID=G7I6D8_MEDTR|nr:PPR repeat protein [Medicago truncatula]